MQFTHYVCPRKSWGEVANIKIYFSEVTYGLPARHHSRRRCCRQSRLSRQLSDKICDTARVISGGFSAGGKFRNREREAAKSFARTVETKMVQQRKFIPTRRTAAAGLIPKSSSGPFLGRFPKTPKAWQSGGGRGLEQQGGGSRETEVEKERTKKQRRDWRRREKALSKITNGEGSRWDAAIKRERGTSPWHGRGSEKSAAR